MDQTIQDFIFDVKTGLDISGASDEGLNQLVERMRQLVVHPEVIRSHETFIASSDADLYKDTGRKSSVLYTDETGLTLVRSYFDPKQATPIHSHSTWGVVGVYAGKDIHKRYRRKDGGSGAGFAELELVEDSILEAGDVVTIPHPPHDIHSQQGYGGQPCYELVLFGDNAMTIPRLIFDLEQNTAREVIPGSK